LQFAFIDPEGAASDLVAYRRDGRTVIWSSLIQVESIAGGFIQAVQTGLSAQETRRQMKVPTASPEEIALTTKMSARIPILDEVDADEPCVCGSGKLAGECCWASR
jgi:hypothetical protein